MSQWPGKEAEDRPGSSYSWTLTPFQPSPKGLRGVAAGSSCPGPGVLPTVTDIDHPVKACHSHCVMDCSCPSTSIPAFAIKPCFWGGNEVAAQSHSPPWQPRAAMCGFQEARKGDKRVPLPALSCCPWAGRRTSDWLPSLTTRRRPRCEDRRATADHQGPAPDCLYQAYEDSYVTDQELEGGPGTVHPIEVEAQSIPSPYNTDEETEAQERNMTRAPHTVLMKIPVTESPPTSRQHPTPDRLCFPNLFSNRSTPT
ncbi:uncharacterized protein LOC125938344 [Panthera uncia]|uniref:uncharacterized protein LOC125938344 n=1 Tax=Panthera uncia TaxID=29064 RepID=UPI0020FFCBF5|nr:uncharacterized protein LOC125938344 [Panthera uncia]